MEIIAVARSRTHIYPFAGKRDYYYSYMVSSGENNTRWKTEFSLLYPVPASIEAFVKASPESKFLLALFSGSAIPSLHELVPVLRPVYDALPRLAEAESIQSLNVQLLKAVSGVMEGEGALFRLANVLALYYVVMQLNLTGPPTVFPEDELKKFEDMPKVREVLLGTYSRSGEEIYRKTHGLLVIHLMSLVLETYSEDVLTVEVWKARLTVMLNELLSSNVPHLKDASMTHYKAFLETYVKNCDIHCLEAKESGEREYKADDKEALRVFGMINIEFAFCALTFYKYSLAEHCLEAARTIGGIHHHLTGKMGRRTKYQENALSQLVLDIHTEGESKAASSAATGPQNVKLEEDSILYEQPIIEGADPLLKESITLSLYDQMYLNGFCRYVMFTRPKDVILRETLGPYISKALEKSNAWVVYSCSLLHRSRNELDSTKKKERSLLQLQALVDQFKDKEPSAVERFNYLPCSGYPLNWTLRKELARDYMQIGCFSSAYEMLCDMELYEDSVQCLYMSGRKTEATERANEILKRGGREAPGIMCLLADFAATTWEEKEKYYKEAWSLSQGKCPRALRTLGRLYYELKRYKEAAENLETALKINTLYPNSWFSLGCCYLQMKMWDKAIYAFGWVVQVDENSSDGWSNLGVCYTQLNKYREAVSCYEQALKISRTSWKIWQNYIVLSLEIPDILRTIGAVRQLMIMEQQSRVPVPFVAKLLSTVASLQDGSKQKTYEDQTLRLLHDMAQNDSANTLLWGLYSDAIDMLRVKKATPEKKVEECKKWFEVMVKQCRSIMLNPNWDHFEYLI